MAPDRLGTIEGDIRAMQNLILTQVIGQLAVIIDNHRRHADYQLTCDAERKAVEIRVVKLEDFATEQEEDAKNSQTLISNRTAMIFNLLAMMISIAAIYFGVKHG